ncbi:MAG: CbiX/SirB N-terminal domain-containing protein [Corynebacterium striatum]|nr:CbiX/SirB N-terminal domain-containing protein [Corynebacterium striatum]
MSALITLSHGSRHPEAALGIEALTRKAAALAGATSYEAAYLDFHESDLEAAAQRVATAGQREAVVVPLLFTRGYHLRVDVPEAIDRAAQSAGLRLLQAEGLGTGADIAELLAARAMAPQTGKKPQHLVIYAVGSSDEKADSSVRDLAANVESLTHLPTSVVFATRGGKEGVVKQVRRQGEVRVLPLFSTAGLLLDLLVDSPAQVDSPLGTDLAGVVADRFAHAAGLSTQTHMLAQIGS